MCQAVIFFAYTLTEINLTVSPELDIKPLEYRG